MPAPADYPPKDANHTDMTTTNQKHASPILALGEEVMRRLDIMAECSEPGPGVTRLPFTPEHHCALKLLREWMEAADLAVHLDDAGTLIGRREGEDSSKTLLLGSHQDSIPHGGRYDGILGIVLPIVCLEALRAEKLPYAVEILAFADEEGVRFPTALLGPRALTGTLDLNVLDRRDRAGISVRQAMSDHALQPDNIPALARSSEDIIGYVEVHIEQGPVLYGKKQSIGIVTAICGIERWSVSLHGRAAHAGTTPMNIRLDALAGAAEAVTFVEQTCRQTSDLVGTVGSLHVTPNAVNVIPARADFSVELRSGDEQLRSNAAAEIVEHIKQTAAKRNLDVSIEQTYVQSATQCDADLSGRLEDAAKSKGFPGFRLVSGATHDASAMAALAPVAMLFVSCRDGISHHHAESITSHDAGVAATVLTEFLVRYVPY